MYVYMYENKKIRCIKKLFIELIVEETNNLHKTKGLRIRTSLHHKLLTGVP